jgi:hypothetical protein
LPLLTVTGVRVLPCNVRPYRHAATVEGSVGDLFRLRHSGPNIAGHPHPSGMFSPSCGEGHGENWDRTGLTRLPRIPPGVLPLSTLYAATMDAGAETSSSMSGTMTTFGGLTPRWHVGRPRICQLDGSAGGYLRLTAFDDQGGGETVVMAPVAQVEQVRLDVGNLVIRVGGGTYRVILAPPDVAARLGMALSTFGAASPAVGLAGSAAAGLRMARREKLVDPEGLRWLRFFAAHGVTVEAPARWKPRVRYGLMGVALLLTAIGVLGSFAGVAEEGGWTTEARQGVFGMAVLVGFIWGVYWATVRLLQRTVGADTARRVGTVP